MEIEKIVCLGHGINEALIKAPIESIDLAKWLFSLTNEEYAACSSGHNGMVQGYLPNGKRVSVSVETIGGNFIVNNFIEEVSHLDQVRAVSDSIIWLGGANGVHMIQLKVTWELKISSVSAQSCMLNCSVMVETGNMDIVEMFQSLAQSGSDPNQEHWIGETPYFAADIERKALMGMLNKG